MKPAERRIAVLEAAAPPVPSPYNLDCLTDDELIVLATLPEEVPPHLADEVDRIMAKAEAYRG